ncbi:hypothetical protein ACHAWF_002853 [Thalassiosira exigua]
MTSASPPIDECLVANALARDAVASLPLPLSGLWNSSSTFLGDRCSSGSSSAWSSAGASAPDRLRLAVEGLRRTPPSSLPASTSVPDLPGPLGALSGDYELDFPDARSLLSLAAGTCLAVGTGAILATVVYFALLPREGTKRRPPRLISPTARASIGSLLLLGCALLPYALTDVLGESNSAVRFSYACLFVPLYFFRVLEALFGFVPKGAMSSWRVYCAYFSLPFDMAFVKEGEEGDEEKPAIATRREVLDGMAHAAKACASMTVLLSVLSPSGFLPFGETFGDDMTLGDYFRPGHLGNCFVIALFFQQALALGDACTGCSIQLFLGYRARGTMRSPLLRATSPSDFWGRRWNVLVHAVLKRGAYKPARSLKCSPAAASLAAFAASGLFHEWLVHVVLMYDRSAGVAERDAVRLGSNAAFFLWNFVVIVCERALARTEIARSIASKVPAPLVPLAIVMTSLPVAHWFGEPYLRGGFFGDYGECSLLVRRV